MTSLYVIFKFTKTFREFFFLLLKNDIENQKTTSIFGTNSNEFPIKNLLVYQTTFTILLFDKPKKNNNNNK